MHLSQAAHGLGEVEVNVVVAAMAGQDAHRELVDSGSMLAVGDKVHESVKEGQARVLQGQAEITLCIVHPDRAKLVLNLECDCEEVGVALRVARVPHKEGSVGLPLKHGLCFPHCYVAIVVAGGGEG